MLRNRAYSSKKIRHGNQEPLWIALTIPYSRTKCPNTHTKRRDDPHTSISRYFVVWSSLSPLSYLRGTLINTAALAFSTDEAVLPSRSDPNRPHKRIQQKNCMAVHIFVKNVDSTFRPQAFIEVRVQKDR